MSSPTQQSPSDIGANDALRFLLEMAALAALAYWGWATFAGLTRWAVALGLPVVAAALWGVFRVPGDGGPPVVPVPGLVRLGLEAVLFGAAVALLWLAGQPLLAVGLGVLVVGHYVLARDRVRWLVGA